MVEVKAIVLRAAGINCDMETEYALELAAAKAQRMHINRIIEDKSLLDEFQIVVFPGGFSYGDDVAAGKILANQIVHHLFEPIKKFIEDGKLVLGICNGFQVLVKTGILPGGRVEGVTPSNPPVPLLVQDARDTMDALDTSPAMRQAGVTITNNDSGKFEDRWVYLAPQSNRCVFIEPGRRIYLPIAHGEGKVVTRDEAALDSLMSGGHIAFKYVDKDGNEGDYPVNPNGSTDSIAGLTDTTGRVLGMMPHPERFVRPTQHPHWSRLKDVDNDGMTIFNNAVKYARENL